MLRLPQFSIAQIMGFTFVIALNVWGFVWDFSFGFWSTVLSQVLFWSMLRINAGLKLEPGPQTNVMTRGLDWTIAKLAVGSVFCSFAGAIAFCTVCTVTATPVALQEFAGPTSSSTNFYPYVLFGLSMPLGTLAAAAWLWWTWPRR